MLKSKRSLLFVVVLTVASFLWSVPVKAGPSQIHLTWMGVTSWLFEVADLRIVMDGYITRNPTQALGPDEEAIQQVMDVLGGNGKVDYILSGHGHFDHAFDTAVWARETGAQIIGSRSTCFEAIAQGIPASQCTLVEGGEVLELGKGVTVRVVRWNHWGDPSVHWWYALLQAPVELKAVPDATNGLRPGVFDDFPNGGGTRSYLFTVDTSAGKRLSLFWSSSGEAAMFNEEKVVVNEADFDSHGIAHDHLEFVGWSNSEQATINAMAAADLDSVDLWIGSSDGALVELVNPILNPAVYIQHHWDGLATPIVEGLPFPFPNDPNSDGGFDASLIKSMDEAGIPVLPHRQFMDKFKLDKHGVTPVPNHNVKQKLELSDVQEF